MVGVVADDGESRRSCWGWLWCVDTMSGRYIESCPKRVCIVSKIVWQVRHERWTEYKDGSSRDVSAMYPLPGQTHPNPEMQDYYFVRLDIPICLSSLYQIRTAQSRNLKSNTSEFVFKSSRNLRGICTTIASSNQENQLAEVLAGHGGQRGVSLH